ncbi:ribonuclease H-like domain-containing protein [Tanacetum coccineum]|uniref:Ribonuclease H-like domain-containing protein n=1 Tax=Tanacetum coccineum TaxID=301880 RepID=A0ABQ4YTW0_9ASTR
MVDRGSKGYITGKGRIRVGNLDFDSVSFVKELGHFNLFSISQICDKQRKVLFTKTKYLVVSSDFKMPDENQILLKVPRHHNMYSFDMKTPSLTKDYACLIAKATCDESKIVSTRGLSWVFFLAFKDETSGILQNFIRQIENQLNHRVKIIRSDNGTEFKNRDMLELCGNRGIKQEYSNARTPQQNGVTERMNGTLIEAARTMLVDSLLLTTFWAEAVSTACYIFNRVHSQDFTSPCCEEIFNTLREKPNLYLYYLIAMLETDHSATSTTEAEYGSCCILFMDNYCWSKSNAGLWNSMDLQMYALTINPIIHDSLVKQIWQSATAKTLADGTLELQATIDTIAYTVTEASIRRKEAPSVTQPQPSSSVVPPTPPTTQPIPSEATTIPPLSQPAPPTPIAETTLASPSPLPSLVHEPIEHTFEQPSSDQQPPTPRQEATISYKKIKAIEIQGNRYKRRKSSKEFAGTGLDFKEVKSAFEEVNTGGIKVSSGIEEINAAPIRAKAAANGSDGEVGLGKDLTRKIMQKGW